MQGMCYNDRKICSLGIDAEIKPTILGEHIIFQLDGSMV